MSPFKAAIVQDAPIVFDRQATMRKVASLAAEAAATGASLVLFPEAFVPGFPSGLDWGGRAAGIREDLGPREFQRYWDNAIDIPGPEVNQLGEIAARHNIHLVIGCIERVGGTLYCAILFFAPDGSLIGRRRKIMPTSAERLVWGQSDGSSLRVFATALGRMGAVICWENYMPLLRTAMYGDNIQIYLAPTADDWETWLPTMRHIAIEGRCFVLSSCQFTRRSDFPADYEGIPSNDPNFIVSHGGSCIIDPTGAVLAEPVFDRAAILTAEIDPGKITQGKYWFDAVGHYARPDIFTLQVDRREKKPVQYQD